MGTENLPAAMGMAAALEAGGFAGWASPPDRIRDFCNALDDGPNILTPGAQCPHIRALVHPAMSAQALLIRLDAMGFAVSAGSACSSGSLKPSRVLKAFGIDEDRARRTIRVSLGWSTTPAEIDAFVQAWKSLP
jgi:cysteine desulfurase